jgi:hypothetical protein
MFNEPLNEMGAFFMLVRPSLGCEIKLPHGRGGKRWFACTSIMPLPLCKVMALLGSGDGPSKGFE